MENRPTIQPTLMRRIINFMAERQVVLALFILGAALLAYVLRYVLLIFFLAYVTMAGLVPVVSFLRGKKVPRWLAIAAPYLIVAAAILSFIGIYLPTFTARAGAFTSQLPLVIDRISGFFHIHLNVNPSQLLGDIVSLFNVPVEGGAFSLVSTAGYLLIGVVAVLVASIYMLLARENVYEQVRAAASDGARDTVTDRMFEAERSLGRWIRAQLILSASIGIMVWIFLLVLGVPYAAPLGVLSAIFELIPYAGPILSAIPAIALASEVSVTRAVIVLIGFVVIHQLENHVLVPNIMKGSIGLPPLIVIFAVLAGAEVGGILGAFVAVPLCTLIWSFIKHPGGG